MGLWAGGLGDWARGGRRGEVALPTTGESGLGCRVGSFWAMVSIAFGGSEVLVRRMGVGDSGVGLSCLKILKSRRRNQMILWRWRVASAISSR